MILVGGSPAAPTLVARTGWTGWTVDGASDDAAGSAAEGTLELSGTVRTVEFRVEHRSTARNGSTTAPPVLRQTFTVTVDEDLGTVPQACGNASHVLSDLFLGAGGGAAAGQDRPDIDAQPGLLPDPLRAAVAEEHARPPTALRCRGPGRVLRRRPRPAARSAPRSAPA
ncbi:hypothetical protein [Kitasatospora sp. NPDC017646]|uniref:hypothetical protein n=1 Tax=Kitasatospora sp. NPDC017646 TaxID=3364024 RepID=UPI0037AD7123